MKAITRNKIKTIAKQYVTDEYNDLKYEAFKEIAPDVTKQTAAMFLYALKLHGHFGKTRLQRAFDWFIAVQNMPPVMGKNFECYDAMKLLEKNYGIDFSKINVKLESKEKFDKEIRRNK